ncbi:hypothetical protein PHISCL_05192 [Aspergillus sclerotialis]|uniref:Uncharacterized protein n=1 Tax=Aspergillus sclerotialis TaxID=2070753 RepID=A0A3A2ZIU1_9EURO|nr:hypothetical protein PHISCL_05192 [Aspergillus sclerotialis]
MSTDRRNTAILRGVLLRIRTIKHFITRYDMDEEKMVNAPLYSDEYGARALIIMEMVAVSEALCDIKGGGFRGRFPEIFEHMGELIRQRNVIAHDYGQTFKDYPALEAAIEKALKDLSTPIKARATKNASHMVVNTVKDISTSRKAPGTKNASHTVVGFTASDWMQSWRNLGLWRAVLLKFKNMGVSGSRRNRK